MQKESASETECETLQCPTMEKQEATPRKFFFFFLVLADFILVVLCSWLLGGLKLQGYTLGLPEGTLWGGGQAWQGGRG